MHLCLFPTAPLPEGGRREAGEGTGREAQERPAAGARQRPSRAQAHLALPEDQRP